MKMGEMLVVECFMIIKVFLLACLLVSLVCLCE